MKAVPAEEVRPVQEQETPGMAKVGQLLAGDGLSQLALPRAENKRVHRTFFIA